MAQRSEIEAHPVLLPGVDCVRDYGPNGLQVEGRAEVRRLVSGITASSPQAWPVATVPLGVSVLRR